MTEAPVTARNAIREALEQSHAITGSWRVTGAFLGLSGAGAFRVVRGDWWPSNTATLARMGMDGIPPVILSRPVCCACGCGVPFVPSVWNQRRIPGHPRRRNPRGNGHSK